MSRIDGGKELASIEDCVDTSIQRFQDYLEKRIQRLITATRNNAEDRSNNGTEISRKQKWKEKQL